jgi:hypothetical protein
VFVSNAEVLERVRVCTPKILRTSSRDGSGGWSIQSALKETQ